MIIIGKIMPIQELDLELVNRLHKIASVIDLNLGQMQNIDSRATSEQKMDSSNSLTHYPPYRVRQMHLSDKNLRKYHLSDSGLVIKRSDGITIDKFHLTQFGSKKDILESIVIGCTTTPLPDDLRNEIYQVAGIKNPEEVLELREVKQKSSYGIQKSEKSTEESLREKFENWESYKKKKDKKD